MTQETFNVTRHVIRKDENQKWDRLKDQLTALDRLFDEGKVVNNIPNGAFLKKILRKMERLENDS